MMHYKDKTFCASPHCKNECGRKLTEKDREGAKALGLPLSLGYFCDISLEAKIVKKESLMEGLK